jgi:hypothetical protein
VIRTDPATGEFQFRIGDEWRTLRDPHGPATWRQLMKLNALGLLQLRALPARPLSKLDCAWEIDQAEGEA